MLSSIKAKAKAKVAVRRRREAKAKQEAELKALIASMIPAAQNGRDGRDAPTLEEILENVKPLLPETKIVHTKEQVVQEIDEEKIKRLAREVLPERSSPEIQIIREELELDTSEFITKDQLDEVLKKIDRVIQANRGGGAVKQVPEESYQFVSSPYDFGQPKNGVITLESNKTYFLVGDIDLQGLRLVLQENTCLLGPSSENAFLTSTGLDPDEYMIRTDWTFPCRHITFYGVDKAIGVNLNNASTDPNLALDWTGVNFFGCTTNIRAGDMDNFIYDKGAVLGAGSFEFFGQVGTIGIANSLFTGSGADYSMISIESTANISRRFRIIYSSLVAFGSTKAINVDVGAAILNQSYILDTCNFSGGGTYLLGVDSVDNKALFINNVGITNSSDVSQYYMHGNTTPTIITTAGVEVKAAGATTLAPVTSKFTHTDNRATYVGALTQYFKATATMSVTSGNNRQIGAYIAKNGIPLSESEIYVTTNGAGRAENVAIGSLVELTSGDYIEVFVENVTNTENITVTDLVVIVE